MELKLFESFEINEEVSSVFLLIVFLQQHLFASRCVDFVHLPVVASM